MSLDLREELPGTSERSRQQKHQRMLNTEMTSVQRNCWEETTNCENPLQGGYRPYGVKISMENFKVNRKSLNRRNQEMTLKIPETTEIH